MPHSAMRFNTLKLLGLQSLFRDKPVKFKVIRLQNGTAVLKGSHATDYKNQNACDTLPVLSAATGVREVRRDFGHLRCVSGVLGGNSAVASDRSRVVPRLLLGRKDPLRALLSHAAAVLRQAHHRSHHVSDSVNMPTYCARRTDKIIYKYIIYKWIIYRYITYRYIIYRNIIYRLIIYR